MYKVDFVTVHVEKWKLLTNIYNNKLCVLKKAL